MTRVLAARGIAPLEIDASPGMISLARSHAAGSRLLQYRVVNITADPVPRLLPATRRRRAAVEAQSERHGRGEEYLHQSEVDRVYRAILPGARIHHHLGWRYTAVWHS
jgi:hypothetical protein